MAMATDAFPALDVHQHLWPETVLRVLEARRSAPRALWRDDGRWEVRLEAEPAFEIDPADHDPLERARALSEQGFDSALVSLSCPVATESLLTAVAAWNESGEALPGGLGWWAALPSAPGMDRLELVREALAAGAAGVCLPATELARPSPAAATLDVLELTESEGLAVFVHPGPARPHGLAPAWWAPATDYVAQQHAAWHTWMATVRRLFPRLRAIFALLAGLAPLHLERGAARGGPAVLDDPLTFYDTSSYGPRAVRALASAVGFGQLVHGSDHPVLEGGRDPVAEAFGPGVAEIVRRENPARALGLAWTPA